MKAADARAMTPDQLNDELAKLKKEQFSASRRRPVSWRTPRAFAKCGVTSRGCRRC